MEDLSPKSSLRDRILNDLKITIKQIYHESVNNELGEDNKSYLCYSLIKHLDEALRYGLKHLYLGYWKAVERLLHRHALDAVNGLPVHSGGSRHLECSSLTKGRAWLALSLNDDSLVSYIECLARDGSLDSTYEPWSILKHSDSSNTFLSILAGLDNVSFHFQVDYCNKPPTSCRFAYKNIQPTAEGLSLHLRKQTSSACSLASPGDSGVVIQDSASDIEQTEIDFINGNIPESVVLRKRKKKAKRHVSFHEDIMLKSPDKCRKLKWDCESQRYSWSGEELDFEPTVFTPRGKLELDLETMIASTPRKLNLSEREAPEGEETPTEMERLGSKLNQVAAHKSLLVRRFLQSIKQSRQSKQKPFSCRYNSTQYKPLVKGPLSRAFVDSLNKEIDLEIKAKPRSTHAPSSLHLNQLTKHNETVYKTYQLRDMLCILTDQSIYLYNSDIFRVMRYHDLDRIRIYPGGEVFDLIELDNTLRLVGADEDSTNEMMGRIEWCMRRRGLDPPDFEILKLEDLSWMRQRLTVLDETDELTYFTVVRLQKEAVEQAEVQLTAGKRGCLMYRDVRTGEPFQPGEFVLKGGILYLFTDDGRLPQLAINLSANCKSCSRVSDPHRPHTFQLTLAGDNLAFQNQSNCFYEDVALKSRLASPTSEAARVLDTVRSKFGHWFGSKRSREPCVVHFAASNEVELIEWLETIIETTCVDSCEDAGKEETMDSVLLLTKQFLLLVTDSLLPCPNVELVSSAQISEIASLKLGCHENDVFVSLEFTCVEASNNSGDWHLQFATPGQLKRFKMALEVYWKQPFPLPIEILSSTRLNRQ